MFCFV